MRNGFGSLWIEECQRYRDHQIWSNRDKGTSLGKRIFLLLLSSSLYLLIMLVCAETSGPPEALIGSINVKWCRLNGLQEKSRIFYDFRANLLLRGVVIKSSFCNRLENSRGKSLIGSSGKMHRVVKCPVQFPKSYFFAIPRPRE